MIQRSEYLYKLFSLGCKKVTILILHKSNIRSNLFFTQNLTVSKSTRLKIW